MLAPFALLLMIVMVGLLGLLAEKAFLFALINVIVAGFLAGGMRVRVRLRGGDA